MEAAQSVKHTIYVVDILFLSENRIEDELLSDVFGPVATGQ